jgi:hypothetical protein
MDEGGVLLEVAGPEEVWVSRDPDLGEGDEGGVILSSFGACQTSKARLMRLLLSTGGWT